MRGRDGVPFARAPGCVLAPGVPDPGVDPRLVVRDPVPDAVAEAAHDGLRVLGAGLRGRARRPAARVLEHLRRVPVEEGRERLDLVREQLVDQTIVEVEPGLVDRAPARRDDPRPRDREAKRTEPELLYQGDVVAIPAGELACVRAGDAVTDLARGRAAAVPGALGAAVSAGSACRRVRRR